MDAAWCCSGDWTPAKGSAPQGATTAVLVPGSDKQTQQGHRNQAQNDAAEERFDHRSRKIAT